MSRPANKNRATRTAVVLPAYNAEQTLERTYRKIPRLFRENVILVDDFSDDATVKIAQGLGIKTFLHSQNLGYGANQKTLYSLAMETQADFVVMLHPDDQYDARVIPVMVELIDLGICDIVLGNRISSRKDALIGGMPPWKYVINRVSTLFENMVLGTALGDFHSGMRAYSAACLRRIPFEHNSDDFAFDQEMLIQASAAGFRIGDIPIPVRYPADASSIGFRRSLVYGWMTLIAILRMRLAKANLTKDSRFPASLFRDKEDG